MQLSVSDVNKVCMYMYACLSLQFLLCVSMDQGDWGRELIFLPKCNLYCLGGSHVYQHKNVPY